MSTAVLRELDCMQASTLLGDLGPDDSVFLLSDAAGQCVWSSVPHLAPEVGLALAALGAGASDGTKHVSPDVCEQRLGDRGLLLSSIVRATDETPVGWLSATLDGDDASGGSAEGKRLVETLPRVAAFLEKEYRLRAELNSAVDELAERYEELNLVFALERQAREVDRHSVAIESMLQGFTRHLRVDVALFAAPEHGVPLHALGGRRKISNIDLVLVELRGRMWRFLAASKKTIVMNEPDDPRRGYLLTHLPFKALAVPSAGCGSVDSGLMLLRHIDEPDFTNSEVSLAQVFIGQAMIMLRNQALAERMERFTREMASSLVEAVEAKDPYTRGHSERVELITAGLGRGFAVEERELDDLLWGALLHDIGKIGIPDSILMKPGKLTDDEYTFIKTHPERSYEILKHIRQLGESALAGARYHQERFDGTGYPFGLRGSEIPLSARIVAIADTYDAVTTSRSYRSASTHERGMEIVREVSGSQLDPELVQVFCSLVENDQEWLRAIRPKSGPNDD